mmetsp:Transcript_50419/g.109281  ORF Transcript_50419/g.109281 Transcript_50419/m.109281 type:complete len:83 (-) Transcript_50419:325-573(-)
MLSEIVLRHSLAASPEAGRLHNPVGLAKQLAGALGRFFVQRPLHFSNLFFKLDVPGNFRNETLSKETFRGIWVYCRIDFAQR